jgi:hypothetical protein
VLTRGNRHNPSAVAGSSRALLLVTAHVDVVVVGAPVGQAVDERGVAVIHLAAWVNPRVRGWMQYYGAFYHSALCPLLTRINAYVMRWLRKKHKRLRGRKKAQEAWTRAVTTRPRFFAHWAWVTTVPAVW